MAWKRIDPQSKQQWIESAEIERKRLAKGGQEEYNKCSNCEKKFRNSRHYRYHEKNCKDVICDTCGKTFKSAINLRHHSVVHTEKHKCETCNKTFSSNYKLVQHRAMHTGKTSIFPCSICNSKFTQKSSLKRHMDTVHKS